MQNQSEFTLMFIKYWSCVQFNIWDVRFSFILIICFMSLCQHHTLPSVDYTLIGWIIYRLATESRCL